MKTFYYTKRDGTKATIGAKDKQEFYEKVKDDYKGDAFMGEEGSFVQGRGYRICLPKVIHK